MSKPEIFSHPMFGNLPVVVLGGTEWFGATEAATALSFSNPHAAIQNHIEEDDLTVHEVIDSIGRKQLKKFSSESGLYSLIFGAAKQGNNPEIQAKAKEFKRWVTGEVLPTIRQHGAYMTPAKIEEVLLNPDTIINLAQRLKLANQEKERLSAQIEADKPKVLFADSVAASKSSILIGDLAKILKQNGVETGQKRLFAQLRDEGYLIKRKGADYNMPTQRSMELGLFEIKETSITHSDGHVTISKTPKVTGKGQIYFINKYKASEAS
ncbi:phage antirepressor KilAC domain-containing protein [Paenibacillus sp. VCA1]|uniref:phage antirepressor KilAC domain-containing protein n=1 Tax=Paenibacillus sp. VCA1 TaxID=3039148 RepID=UPI00287102C0|nr:phage antirepressor KilAC domain-containing protein [Paenibacillus sp. VCA1]MDR9857774.1 phage antirepressor KilAC domain-containing protein [Paenibacillus sp. VCA1]